MAYLHISNLYKDNTIQLFKECWALEKVHGTSAHVKFVPDPSHPEGGVLHLFSGEQQGTFEQLFDKAALAAALRGHGGNITVFGECYGGKIQGMSARYGKDVRFVAFDLMINDRWLCVPEAASRVLGFGLEFVHYERTSTDTVALNALRDAPSKQAERNGMGAHMAEGIVLRPLVELNLSGRIEGRVIAKHKRDDFRETFQPRKVGATLEVLAEANAIAAEWVTPMRLAHVLGRLGNPTELASTGTVIAAMIEDVVREAQDEIVDSRPARQAIAKKAAELYKAQCTRLLP